MQNNGGIGDVGKSQECIAICSDRSSSRCSPFTEFSSASGISVFGEQPQHPRIEQQMVTPDSAEGVPDTASSEAEKEEAEAKRMAKANAAERLALEKHGGNFAICLQHFRDCWQDVRNMFDLSKLIASLARNLRP